MGRAIGIGHACDDGARQAMLLFARQTVEVFDKPFGLDRTRLDEPIHDEAIDAQERKHFRADLFFCHLSLHPTLRLSSTDGDVTAVEKTKKIQWFSQDARNDPMC